ncbi:MAG: hypothetical protein ACYSWW_10665 [Planctomycetota bacterium]
MDVRTENLVGNARERAVEIGQDSVADPRCFLLSGVLKLPKNY